MDRAQLEGLTIDGMDLVLLLLNVTVEIVSAVSPTKNSTENRLIDVANKLEGFAKEITEPRLKLLMTELAHALIATERTT